MIITDHNEIFQILKEKAGDVPMQLPPNVIIDMQGEFISFDRDKMTLKARFPVLERYQNPLGYMQGGVIAAAIDNTLGPLSYLVAPPSVTSQLNLSYIRPITPQEQFVVVEAQVDELTKRQLFLSAKALNTAGKTCVICTTTCTVIG